METIKNKSPEVLKSRAKVLRALADAVRSGYMTINEARAELELKPLSTGDERLREKLVFGVDA